MCICTIYMYCLHLLVTTLRVPCTHKELLLKIEHPSLHVYTCTTHTLPYIMQFEVQRVLAVVYISTLNHTSVRYCTFRLYMYNRMSKYEYCTFECAFECYTCVCASHKVLLMVYSCGKGMYYRNYYTICGM